MHRQDIPYFAFNTDREALDAIHALCTGGFDLTKLSLVGKAGQSDEHTIGFYAVGDRVKTWGRDGAMWQTAWDMLVTPAVFFIPGIGLVVLAGAIVPVLVAAFECAPEVGGVSAFVAALIHGGVRQAHAIDYEAGLKADQLVLMVHGDATDVAEADAMLVKKCIRVSPWPYPARAVAQSR